MGTKTELRNQKRKEVVEAIVVSQEPIHLVARIYQIPQRTIFTGFPCAGPVAGVR